MVFVPEAEYYKEGALFGTIALTLIGSLLMLFGLYGTATLVYVWGVLVAWGLRNIYLVSSPKH